MSEHQATIQWCRGEQVFADRSCSRAVGVLERDGDGPLAVTRVTLFPDVVFSGPVLPTSAEYDALHHKAHARCFIARSVKTTVLCKPLYRSSDAAA